MTAYGRPHADARRARLVSAPVHSTYEPQADVAYLAPSGRPCRCVAITAVPVRGQREAVCLYDLPDGRPARSLMSEGFELREAHWRALRRVG